MKSIIPSLLMCGVIIMSACDRSADSDGPERTTIVSIPDPQGLRENGYELAETGLSDQLFTGDFVKQADFTRMQINSPEDAKNDLVDLTKQYKFDFSTYRYDYIGIQLPDPSWGSRLLESEYNADHRELRFGMYHNKKAGPVPAVVVVQTYLFQYPKP